MASQSDLEKRIDQYLKNTNQGRELVSDAVKNSSLDIDIKDIPVRILEKVNEAIRTATPPQIEDSVSLELSSSRIIKDERMEILLNFKNDSGELHRPSLVPSLYPEGVYNILGLFIKGYDISKEHQVFGTWHGERVGSLLSREGIPIVEHAMSAFIGAYGTEYNVIDYVIDDAYLKGSGGE